MLLDEDTLYRIIGERIREGRSRAQLSQARLAELLHLSRASIVNIEAGRQRPPIHLLWRIAEVLGTEAALLIPRQDEYRASSLPIQLDDTTKTLIEQAANGDLAALDGLTDFVKKVKIQAKARHDEPPSH
ncbi:MAG TPA: helix-turn-helix transcriptional regulator [Bellilinea sp.]|nr:helix-turn-helix transcriptional regulator [Bellilinea sp.]